MINARTDIFLAQIGGPATRFERHIKQHGSFEALAAEAIPCDEVLKIQNRG